MARIRVKNIIKYFGEQKILDNISLDIKDGEIFEIVGPSGCGKTTLLRIIAGIEKYLSFLPKQLSEGHKQTTAVGRSIIKKKINVLLIDEPLSNLDAKVRSQSRYKIKKLIQSLSNTVIYVTANGLEATALCDRIAVLLNKKFIQIGTPEKLYSDPENIFICQLFSKFPINQIDGIIEESNIRSLSIISSYITVLS